MPRFIACVTIVVLAACGGRPPGRVMAASYPFERIEIAGDGSEAWVYLAKGVAVGDVIDLTIFGDLDPKVRPKEPCPFGEPAENVRRKWESLCVYNRRGARVAVVRTEELPSGAGDPIPRYELRALPTNSVDLLKPLTHLLATEKGLKTVALVPPDLHGLGLVFRFEGGQFRGIGATPI